MIEPLRPPATAYFIVVDALGPLAESYFLRRPPLEGVRMEAVGVDNALTQWDLPTEVATAIIPRLRAHPGIRRCVGHAYTERVA